MASKICAICKDNSSDETLLVCGSCSTGFHEDCVCSGFGEIHCGKWICIICSGDDEEEEAYETDEVSNSTSEMPDLPRQTAYQFSDIDETPRTGIIDPSIPDASNWTPEEVENYFLEKGFGEHASVFCKQEIDGMSLMMMRRLDVLRGMGIKLGPALKMYRYVRELQTREKEKCFPWQQN